MRGVGKTIRKEYERSRKIIRKENELEEQEKTIRKEQDRSRKNYEKKEYKRNRKYYKKRIGERSREQNIRE